MNIETTFIISEIKLIKNIYTIIFADFKYRYINYENILTKFKKKIDFGFIKLVVCIINFCLTNDKYHNLKESDKVSRS